jgi:hypothetical protein
MGASSGQGKVGEPDKKGGREGKLPACPWRFELFAVGGVEWPGRGGVGAVRSRGRELTDGRDGCGCGSFSEVLFFLDGEEGAAWRPFSSPKWCELGR